jgi:DNA-binding XRE family transcriptional regulator
MTVQFVEIAGQKMAMLPVAEFDRLVDLAEDKLDVAAAIHSEQRRADGEEYVPCEVVDRLVAGENPLKVWRKQRRLTQAALGKKAGISHGHVAFLEKSERKASVKTWQALAKALEVDLEDILPLSE